MAQDYTEGLPGWARRVKEDDIDKMGGNFAALKSCFSGPTQPPDMVAGMWWYDTTTHILKIRNEANNGWQSVWNLASNKPVIANLSNEITLAMISSTIKDAAAGTASLRTLGTGATQAMPGNAVPAGGSISATQLVAPTAGTTHQIGLIRSAELQATNSGAPVLPGIRLGGASILLSGVVTLRAAMRRVSPTLVGIIDVYRDGLKITALKSGENASYTVRTLNISVSRGDYLDFYFYSVYGTGSFVRNVSLRSGSNCLGVAVIQPQILA